MWIEQNGQKFSVITTDDYEVVIEYALLPYVLKALMHDRRELAGKRLKFEQDYFRLLDHAIKRCQKDIYNNRQTVFREHRVIKSSDWLHHEMMIDDQPYPFNYDKEYAVQWITDKATEYLSSDVDIL